MSPSVGSNSAQRPPSRSAPPNTGLCPAITSKSLTGHDNPAAGICTLPWSSPSPSANRPRRPDPSVSFRLSFHQGLLAPTGAHWLDNASDLSCKDSTRQHSVDDPLLSCKQAHPPDRPAAENAIQPEVLPQQQVDQHRQCHRGDNREQHHEQAAESATERADLQV